MIVPILRALSLTIAGLGVLAAILVGQDVGEEPPATSTGEGAVVAPQPTPDPAPDPPPVAPDARPAPLRTLPNTL